MRIVVKLPSHAYAELQAELERLPARERAERLRLLASLGLLLCKSGVVPAAGPQPLAGAMQPTPAPAEPASTNRFRGIKERLKNGIDGA